jgi:hypothetical protein
MESHDTTPYKGYESLRKTLPISNDNRPSVSLWAILKGSIGKDLTKISFPVYFNEPTSMLQRMAEDIEFTECRKSLSPLLHFRGIANRVRRSPVDAAAADQDSSKRIAYVAGEISCSLSSHLFWIR